MDMVNYVRNREFFCISCDELAQILLHVGSIEGFWAILAVGNFTDQYFMHLSFLKCLWLKHKILVTWRKMLVLVRKMFLRK